MKLNKKGSFARKAYFHSVWAMDLGPTPEIQVRYVVSRGTYDLILAKGIG